MKQIQVAEIGRGAKELNRYPILAGRDAEACLVAELDFYFEHEAIILPVIGECNAYAVLRKPSLIGGRRNLRIRIVEVGIADEDTQKILPLFEDDLETDEVSR